MSTEIRELTEPQAAVLLDVVGEAEMGGFYDRADEAHRSWVNATIHRYFVRGARFFAAFGLDDEPLAYAALLVDDAPGFRCKGELISFGTCAGHRRKGIGSKLIDHITGICQDLGLYCIVTSTYAGDARAVAFYGRNGFCPVALLPGVHGPRDEGQLYLRKLLGSWDWKPSPS
ncbi:MAG: GNAT family N-acetyltransferase [Bacillota bacterium]|nr:GNAT family N-acetyltransferase [Bacillota bacterium]